MHVNNGIVIGPDERLYVAVGSEFNLETGGAQVRSKFLSVNLDGSDLRVFAHGVRNAYDLAFSDVGALFATDNGPDGEEINALEAAEPNTWLFPEELNHIVEDSDYGFPGIFGTPPTGSRTIGPIAEWETHAGAQGLVFNSGERFPGYEGHLFVALYHAGRIDAVELVPNSGTYDTVVREVLEFPCVEGQVFPQPTGHRDCAHMHPLDLDLDADGNLFIAAFGSINSDLSTRINGAVYKVSAF
jgi:glucose/arabinose dehydrogenase